MKTKIILPLFILGSCLSLHAQTNPTEKICPTNFPLQLKLHGLYAKSHDFKGWGIGTSLGHEISPNHELQVEFDFIQQHAETQSRLFTIVGDNVAGVIGQRRKVYINSYSTFANYCYHYKHPLDSFLKSIGLTVGGGLGCAITETKNRFAYGAGVISKSFTALYTDSCKTRRTRTAFTAQTFGSVDCWINETFALCLGGRAVYIEGESFGGGAVVPSLQAPTVKLRTSNVQWVLEVAFNWVF